MILAYDGGRKRPQEAYEEMAVPCEASDDLRPISSSIVLSFLFCALMPGSRLLTCDVWKSFPP